MKNRILRIICKLFHTSNQSLKLIQKVHVFYKIWTVISVFWYVSLKIYGTLKWKMFNIAGEKPQEKQEIATL